MKIRPIFTTKVASDVFNKDGSVYLKKGTAISYATKFNTKKFGEFTLTTPNPVHLFLQNSELLLSSLSEIVIEINSCNKILVFSKYVDGITNYSTDELVRESKMIRSIDDKILYKYLGLASSILVTLISAIEAFVNQEIPNNYITQVSRVDGTIASLDKTSIERKVSLEEKIFHMSNILNKNDYKKKRFWSVFKKVKRIRDDLVHVKTKGSEMVNRHDDLFTELFNLNLEDSQNQLISMINYFHEDYIRQ